MKKVLLSFFAVVILFALAGCSKTCKADGCDNESYKDGYCQYHYALNSLQNAAGELLDDLFG